MAGQVVPQWNAASMLTVATGPIDAANINVFNTGTETFAQCEQLITTSFDLATLATKGHTNYSVGSGPPSDGSSMIPKMSGAHQSRVVAPGGGGAAGDATIGWSGRCVL